MRANPMSVAFGLLGDALLSYDTQGTEQLATPLALLIYSPISAILIGLYFSIFESGGRRTLGKKLLGLEVSKTDGFYINFKEAFLRNLTKVIAALVGGYLLGFFGIIVFTALTTNLEFFLFRKDKEDFRQRYMDRLPKTIILLQDDETKPGVIALPKDERGKKEKEGKKVTFRKRDKELPKEKKVEALPPTKEEGEGEEEEELEEKEEKKEGLVKPSEEEEKEVEEGEKVPFWKKLFGGEKKEEPEEEMELDEEEELSLPPAEKTEESKELDEIALKFMMEFDINEDRARALVDTGYRSVSEFKDAIPKDLIMIKGINPTIAKRIIGKANE